MLLDEGTLTFLNSLVLNDKIEDEKVKMPLQNGLGWGAYRMVLLFLQTPNKCMGPEAGHQLAWI